MGRYASWAIGVVVVGVMFGYGIFVRPRTGHASVDSAHRLASGAVLTLEKLGGGNVRSIVPRTERLRLVDPLTGKQLAFAMDDEFPRFVGESDVLWFYDSGTRALSARSVSTLEPVAVPPGLPRIQDVSFDKDEKRVWITGSDGFAWRVDGKTVSKSDAPRPDSPRPSHKHKWDFTSGFTRESLIAPDGTKLSTTFIRPHLVADLDDGPVVASRDSTIDLEATMNVTRVNADGSTRWTVNLGPQDRVLNAWSTSDVAILVTRGRYGAHDLLTTLALNDGHVVAQYEY